MAYQASEASVSAILKEVYVGGIEDQLNEEVALWAIMDRDTVTLPQGQHLVKPFRVSRNQGIGARNDTDVLPQSGAQGLANAKINMSTNYLVGQITGRVIRTSYTDEAAFENALEEEIKFNLGDVANELGYQAQGLLGVRTTVNGNVSSSTTVVVNSTQYLAVGMLVEFWSGSSNQTTNDSGLQTGRTGTAIATITPSTNTITVTTSQTTITSGATVARAGNMTSATVTKEMVGLDWVLDDGTDYPSNTSYFGASRATYPVLYGNRVSANHTTSENIMQQAFDLARAVGGGIIDAIFLDYASRRAYSNLLTSNKRYPIEGIDAPQFAGGIKVSQDLRTQLGEGLSFSGASVIPSRLSPPAKMFMLDSSTWHIYQQSEVEWLMNGDSVLHPLLAAQGLDAYEFGLYYDAQIYCDAPNRNAKVVQTF